MSVQTSYNDTWFNLDYRKNVIATFGNIIKDKVFDFDGIVVRGMSGMLMGPILADKYNLKLMIARKECELTSGNSHASYMLEGNTDFLKYVIVDDCVSMGGTVRGIIKDIQDRWDKEQSMTPRYAGLFLYNQCHLSKNSFKGWASSQRDRHINDIVIDKPVVCIDRDTFQGKYFKV